MSMRPFGHNGISIAADGGKFCGEFGDQDRAIHLDPNWGDDG
jgi:hypothetical protein